MSETVDQALAYLTKGAVDLVDAALLRKKLERAEKTGEPLVVKAGFDPSAPDLHLGHTVVIRKMKHFQDLGHSVVFVIAGQDRDDGLQEDGTVIHLLVHQVDGAAGESHSVVESGLLHVKPREGREERGVDVEDPVPESVDQHGGKQPHVAGQTDQIHLRFQKLREDRAVVLLPAGIVHVGENRRGDTPPGRNGQPGGAGEIGDDQYAVGWEPVPVHRVQEGDHVGASPRDENRDVLQRHLPGEAPKPVGEYTTPSARNHSGLAPSTGRTTPEGGRRSRA